MTARFLALYTTPTDPAAFDRHRHVHVPLAKRLPGLRSYTVSRGLTPVRGDTEFYLVAQLEWDDLDSLRAAFASHEGQATATDVPNLTQYAQTTSMIYQTDEGLKHDRLPRPGPGDKHMESPVSAEVLAHD